MPKAILEFNLPEDREDYEMHYNASKYFCAIHDIKNYLRSLRKHDDRESIPKEELIDKIQECISDLD